MKTKNQNNNMTGIEAMERRAIEQYNKIILQLADADFTAMETFILAAMLAGAALALKDDDFAEKLAQALPSEVLAYRSIIRVMSPELVKQLKQMQQ